MQLTSKYSIKDSVFTIWQAPTQTWVKCPACEGSGKVKLANGERICPECYGRKGSIQYGSEKWQIKGDPITIGEVRIYARNFKKSGTFENVGSYCDGSDSIKVEYMCYETGIGSGTVYYEERLWPSREEAIAECERLNTKDVAQNEKS